MVTQPNLDSLFDAVIAIDELDERARYLDEHCPDPQIRHEVELLLRAHEDSQSFLNQPPPGFDVTVQRDPAANNRQSVLKAISNAFGVSASVSLQDSSDALEEPVQQLSSPQIPRTPSDSRYQLFGEIARGGMGAIIKGRDTDLGRDLAVKVLLEDHVEKPEVIQRFVEEAQIGGQLQHPGIAPVYELGQFVDQRPYFTMKLVKGKTLAALLEARKSVDSDRAKFIGIFEQVCQTMAYAHSRGVIHRDLKPANIMVGAFGEVQVMDWGLAKVLSAGGVADEKKAIETHQDRSIIETLRSSGSDTPTGLGSQTQMGSVMGTPAYMPPEQALGEVDQVDQRADVFGLGAILCEILTGKPPYVDSDPVKVFRQASRGKLDACRERLTHCGADEDLVKLAEECLSPEKSDRPSSAGILADRVSEFEQMVAARLRESEIDRATQTAKVTEERKRRRMISALAASVVALVVTVGGATLWIKTQETAHANDLAETNEQLAKEQAAKLGTEKAANEKLRRVLYQSDIRRALAEINQGNYEDAKAILLTHVPDDPAHDLRGFEWHYLYRRCPTPVRTKLFDWEQGRVLTKPGEFWRKFYDDISRDGKRIVKIFASNSGTQQEITVWDTETGSKVWSTRLNLPTLNPLARLNEDGTLLALSTIGPISEEPRTKLTEVIHIWDIVADRQIATITAKEIPSLCQTGARIEFRPQSSCIAVVNRIVNDGSNLLKTGMMLSAWDYRSRELLFSTKIANFFRNNERGRIAFSGNGRYLAIPSTREFGDDGPDLGTERLQEMMETMSVVDAMSGELVNSVRTTAFRYSAECAFSPDGRLLAIAGRNRSVSASRENAVVDTLLIWDISSGTLVSSAQSRAGGGVVSFSPSGKFVVIDPRNVCNPEVYRVADGALVTRVENPDCGYIHFSEDETRLQAITSEGERLQWELPTQRFNSREYHRGGGCMLSGDGRRLIDVSLSSLEVRLFNTEGQLLDTLQSPWNFSDIYAERGGPVPVQFDQSGKTVAVIHYQDPAKKANVSVSLWDLETREIRGPLSCCSEHESVVAFQASPSTADLACIVSKSSDERATDQLLIWDQETLQEQRIDVKGHARGLSFSLDGKLIAVSSQSRPPSDSENQVDNDSGKPGLLTIYRVSDGSVIHSISTTQVYTNVVFSQDSRLVATTTFDSDAPGWIGGEVEVWDLETCQRHVVLGSHADHGVTSMAFSPEGNRLLVMRVLGDGAVNRYSDRLEIWGLDSGERLLERTYYGHGGMRFRFLPGQHRLFGFSNVSPPQVWDGTPVKITKN